MPQFFPHLWYTRDADKAAEFYCSVFPDSRVDRVTPMAVESPSGPAGSVIVVDFTLMGQRVQAMSAGEHHPFNDAISLVVACDSQDEIDRYWAAVTADGGQEVQCGWLKDRWGVSWQIVPKVLDELMADPDRDKARRVGEAMLKMVKLDIAALEAAARG